MITFEIKNQGIEASSYSNHFKLPPQTISYGLHGYGNNLLPSVPWPKVGHGKKRFESILTGHRTTDTKDKLLRDIHKMLADRTILPADAQILSQGNGRNPKNLEKLNSLFVEIPDTGFGSRTWTVILVDGTGHVDYYENTMQEPINCSATGVENPDWFLSSYDFRLDLA